MKPDKEKFKHLKEGMMANKKVEKTDSISTVKKKIQAIVKQKKLQKVMALKHDVDGLQIEFKDGLMFKTGSAALRPNHLKTVRQVMRVIASVDADYRINIEGHTDDAPFRGSAFFNWELSADRGFSIMQELQRLGVVDARLSVTALAHTRPKVPYKGLKGKALTQARAANRRVVIWLK